MLRPDQTLHKGRYQVITTITQQAAGTIYEAVDNVANQPAVIWESNLPAAPASQIDATGNSIDADAAALAAIEHDCIVKVREHFTDSDRHYLVLEPLTGQDLGKYIEAEASRPGLREVLLWADQLLNALQHLHKLDPPIIHSDIQPVNLKLTPNSKIKLLTTRVASAAKRVRAEKELIEDPAFAYKPIEELWADLNEVTQRVILNSLDEESANLLLRPLDARSDLYSAAAALYHVLTGQRPVDALERSIAILDGKPDPLQHLCEIDAEIAPEVSDAFMRAMSLRRENRFDSAMIMRQVLRTAVVRAQERVAGIVNVPAEPVAAEPAAVEDPLEIEKRRTEEREREILAEQQRLEEEQRRIEQRKLELEAERQRQAAERERLVHEAELEQKRLAREKMELEAKQERERVAQRLAELEAERERERAEEERLRLEAQEEQRRAEQRLEELKREQERHRAEQLRLEQEAKKELELAEQRIKELSFHDLEIEEPAEVPVVDIGTVDLASQSPPKAPNPFEPEVETAPDTQVPHFHEQPGINLRVPAIVGGAGAMVAIALWVSMTMFSTSTASQPTRQQAAAPVIEQPQPQIPDVIPAAQEEPAKADAQPPAELENNETPVTDESEPGRQRRLQTAAMQSKPRRTAPDKTTPAKPKVTVDDLINDN